MVRLSLNEAKDLVRKLARKKEFPQSEAALFQKLLWAFVELGEATDAFKKGEEWENVAEELMDTLFYILDFIGLVEDTQRIQLDLDDIFVKKWEKNLKRPKHYGLRKDIPYSKAITPSPPRKLTLEIVKKCFNKCLYCSAYVSEEDAKKVMSPKDAKKIIDQFAKLGGQELDISGGEPLLHPNWLDISAHAKNKKLKVGLLSCGILSGKEVKQEELLDIVGKISKVGFERVAVTFHAPYSEIHDWITQVKGSFRNTYRFTKLLSSKMDNLEINFVPLQINADEFEELVDFAVSLGIARVNILRFIPQGRGYENKEILYLGKDQTARLMKAALELPKREGLVVNLGHPGDFRFLLEKSHVPKPCTAGTEQCMVKIDGDVIPCPAFGDLREWVAGNVFDQRLEDIWRDAPVFVSLREFDFNRMQGDCKICTHIELCQGRCPAQRIREKGHLYKGPDPQCSKGFI